MNLILKTGAVLLALQLEIRDPIAALTQFVDATHFAYYGEKVENGRTSKACYCHVFSSIPRGEPWPLAITTARIAKDQQSPATPIPRGSAFGEVISVPTFPTRLRETW